MRIRSFSGGHAQISAGKCKFATGAGVSFPIRVVGSKLLLWERPRISARLPTAAGRA